MHSHYYTNVRIVLIAGILALLLISAAPAAAAGTSSPLLGTLQIGSTPSGATVVLDNVNQGTTPVTVRNILAGSHTISLKKEGYYDYETDVSISGGKTTTISVPLVKIPPPANGTLSINSTPKGARITLDDRVVGTTPLTLKNITPGDHVVLLNLSGYDDYTETVSVESSSTSIVDVVLAKFTVAPGSIAVTSTPSLATVYLDNVKRGTTPLTLDNIGPGSHALLLKKSGYNDYRTTVTVVSGRTAAISATLTPVGQKLGTLTIKSTPSGATILLDGVNKGSTPLTLSNVPAGLHAIVLKKTGYSDYKTNMFVVSGLSSTVNAVLWKLPPTTGSIAVNSVPSGATILLDGTSKGTTNRTLDEVAPGTHAIVVKKAGYVDAMTNLTVTAGRTVTYTAIMTPIQATTGTIVIKSRPVGAMVFLDSSNVGQTPVTLDSIPPGIHAITLRAFNYRPYQTNVNVTAGKIIVLNITMTRS